MYKISEELGYHPSADRTCKNENLAATVPQELPAGVVVASASVAAAVRI